MSQPKTAARVAWDESQCYCYLCGYSAASGRGLDTHHIASGAGRQKSLNVLASLLRLCTGFAPIGRLREANDCHARLQGIPELAVPLALKFIADPEHYDLKLVNVLRGRSPGAVTQAEVDAVADLIRVWVDRPFRRPPGVGDCAMKRKDVDSIVVAARELAREIA
jgi:hypothetical protein